jgi:hypothetical protein
MDPGPGNPKVVGFPWWRATLTWMLIILAETVHGALREIFIAPSIGDLRARQVGVLVGSGIILAIALATARWRGLETRRVLLLTGAGWVALTLVFEFALGRAIGASWDRILSDYDPARGGFMALGLAFMLLSPLLAAKLHGGART